MKVRDEKDGALHAFTHVAPKILPLHLSNNVAVWLKTWLQTLAHQISKKTGFLQTGIGLIPLDLFSGASGHRSASQRRRVSAPLSSWSAGDNNWCPGTL